MTQRHVTKIVQKNKITDLETNKKIDHIFITSKINKDIKYNCWWCRLPIENEPIGCPLVFEKDTYFTDGVYCSANCVKAYVLEYLQNDSKYKHSIRLLSLMVSETKETFEPITIKPSLPWRLLIQYGGYVTPEKYKEMNKTITFINKGIKIKPVTILYEEKEKY